MPEAASPKKYAAVENPDELAAGDRILHRCGWRKVSGIRMGSVHLDGIGWVLKSELEKSPRVEDIVAADVVLEMMRIVSKDESVDWAEFHPSEKALAHLLALHADKITFDGGIFSAFRKFDVVDLHTDIAMWHLANCSKALPRALESILGRDMLLPRDGGVVVGGVIADGSAIGLHRILG